MLQGEYGVIREHVAEFESVALYTPGRDYGISGGEEPERVTGAAVTPEFFATLGVQPVRGSVVDGDGDAPVVVLSYALWIRRFGGEDSAIGAVVRVDGRPLTISAVMPRAFDYPVRSELWLVAPLDATGPLYWGSGGHWIVGRLRPGVSEARAAAAIRALSPALSAANPFWTPDPDYRADVRVVSLHEAIVGDVRGALMLLGGAVALLLLIACANVANLVLARGLDRSGELAVRAALGASRGRILRQLVTETVFLAGMGGALGVVFAILAVGTLRRVLPADVPRVAEIGIDVRVLGVSLVLTLVIGVLLGALPARRATRFRVQPMLRANARSIGDRSTRGLSGALVVTQVALAVLLVTGAALLVRSFAALQAIDPGIGQGAAIAARIDLPAAQYASDDVRNLFLDRLLARTAALPGVSAVAATSQLPFSGEFEGSAMTIEHVTTDPNDLPVLIHRRVTPHFFEALGVPLRRGRPFTDADATGPPVAIIDETAARTFWPGEDPIGRRLGRPWLNEMLVIVGVAGAVLDGELTGAAEPTVYTPFAREPPRSAFLVINSASGSGVLPALRSALREIDPTVPLSDAATVRTFVDGTLAGQRLAMMLLGLFGALALTLAAIGIYGVLAYAVGQRTREFALRHALGAHTRDVAAIVLRDGGSLVAAGAAIGSAAALVLGRVVSTMLYGVSPGDARTLLVVLAIILATAAAAAFVPARRAGRIAPMTVLRE